MSDEGNNQLNKQSKFRFLNPDEKKKLKELNEEILGENKNITFDSNVDLTVQFEKKGYDTQRYNIKKLVNERLDATQVYDVSKVLDREKSLTNDSHNGERESQVVEPQMSNMIVTEIYRNDTNQIEKTGDKSNKSVNESNINKRSSDVTENQVKEILKNTSELTQKDNELEANVNQPVQLEKNKNASAIDDNKINSNVKETEHYPPRTYPYNDGVKKIELPKDKREQAKEFFSDDDDLDDEPVKDYTEFKNKAIRVGFYLVIALIVIIIILLTKGLFDELDVDSDESTDNNATINNEITDNDDITDEVVTEDTTDVVEVEPPIDKDVMSDYNAIVEILSYNTNDVVLEITNEDFQYVKESNDTDFFNDYVYANIKNAQPEKEEDRLIVLFGKDDNKHFGSLRYLEDLDFFNSILVDYTKNNITTRYKALSYYKTPTLDSRFYSEMKEPDIAKFISEEVNKSIHTIRKDITIETNSKVLTLVTFDSVENVYHCLHLINVE